MPSASKRVLWVDNDDIKRFRYERRLLKREGWTVQWAEDIDSAREQLAANCFQALISDQSLPFKKHSTPTGIEGGYLLLHWLRKGALPERFDLPQPEPRPSIGEPMPENREIPVLFVSGFYDEDLCMSIRELGFVYGTQGILAKPLDDTELMRFISNISER